MHQYIQLNYLTLCFFKNWIPITNGFYIKYIAYILYIKLKSWLKLLGYRLLDHATLMNIGNKLMHKSYKPLNTTRNISLDTYYIILPIIRMYNFCTYLYVLVSVPTTYLYYYQFHNTIIISIFTNIRNIYPCTYYRCIHYQTRTLGTYILLTTISSFMILF